MLTETSLAALVESAVAADLTVATAESLTGGMVAATLVQVPGSSGMFQGGIIAYQNTIKERLLGVSASLLETLGAVDPQVACAMALGACTAAGARVGISTTGVAGPEPHQGKDVGHVYIGVAFDGEAKSYEYHFAGDREMIRVQATQEAISLLEQVIHAAGEQKL
ncbi:nicotinamide-nucleotide amidase [Arthrobacter alpinus]|uniref:Nicotinamide-nucleotide amidase n=1 Tax=Arthrobacter alpinus TaxID=656366 RepID=A0A1H5JUK8_9MICC|nr:CinA family protein [Arthrobacter alpinus]SEE56239.1 nicotinamide-nucleotide amidase [Arthrobacter alpinus]